MAARISASIPRPLRPGDRGGTGGRGRERGPLAEGAVKGAVVYMVTVALVAELPTVSGFGKIGQVAWEGAPVQVRLTL
jgi:hypothetical protein